MAGVRLMSLTGVATGDDRSVLRGISFLVICLAVFSIMDAISKFAALGFVLFAEFPDRWTIIGAAIIVASGIYVIFRETTLIGRQRAASRPRALPGEREPL